MISVCQRIKGHASHASTATHAFDSMTTSRAIKRILSSNYADWLENVALRMLAAWAVPLSSSIEYPSVIWLHAAYMNQLCTADVTNHCCFRLRAGPSDGFMGDIMEEDIGSIDWMTAIVAIIKDIILPPLIDDILLCYAFRVLIAQLFDRSFALWACIFHLIDPLVDAVVAVLVAATIQ